MKIIRILIFIFFILCVAFSGCISNDSSSAKNTFEPDNFLKTGYLSEDNTTLTMIFDEDSDSDFHWEMTMKPDTVLKILTNEKISSDNVSQKIGKHEWKFEGNTTGTTELVFEYVNPSKNYTPEKHRYSVTNKNGSLEILSVNSFSGNKSQDLDSYSERITISENSTLLLFDGNGVMSTGGGWGQWELKQSQNDILRIINSDFNYNATDPGYGGCVWEIGGQHSGNVILTLNYVNSEAGIVSEIIYEIHNEDGKLSILSASHNSIRSDPTPFIR
jgi:Chagasin family peptidase inhibitor I42.